jgi:hypothetical protein
LGWFSLFFGPVLIEVEQAGKDLVVGQFARTEIIAPAVGVGHGLIERHVGMVEPGGAGVVKL